MCWIFVTSPLWIDIGPWFLQGSLLTQAQIQIETSTKMYTPFLNRIELTK